MIWGIVLCENTAGFSPNWSEFIVKLWTKFADEKSAIASRIWLWYVAALDVGALR